MSYSVDIEGFEGQTIEVEISFWSGIKLFINGNPPLKGPKRGEMILQRNDGKKVIASWKPKTLGLDVPQLVIAGKTIDIVEPLKWYQWVWGAWPIILIFIGGFLGGISGAIGTMVNLRIFRSDMSTVGRYVATGMVSMIAVLFYFVTATLFTLLIKR